MSQGIYPWLNTHTNFLLLIFKIRKIKNKDKRKARKRKKKRNDKNICFFFNLLGVMIYKLASRWVEKN